jgi:hypothetical protein
MITPAQGFAAMIFFLEGYWLRNGKPNEIGALLGSLTLRADGKPADPAASADWAEAVARACRGSGAD